MTKKKILILIDWFYPGFRAGGPIQSCINLAQQLKKDFHVEVLTRDTDFGSDIAYPTVISDEWTYTWDTEIPVFYASKGFMKHKNIKNLIIGSKADFVYLNLLYSPWFVVFPLVLKKMGLLKSTVIICPRGALSSSALRIKKYKKVPFLWFLRLIKIQKKIVFHSTNEEEDNAIKTYFPGAKSILAKNLPKSSLRNLVYNKKESGVLHCLFLARIHSIKNLDYLIRALSETNFSIHLIIIGPIEEEDYWLQCKSGLINLPKQISFDYRGAIPNDQIITFIESSHLLVLPTKGENFGHSIFEFFKVGRPVLISDQTPWRNLQEKKLGWDLSLDNSKAFSAALDIAAGWSQDEYNKYCESAFNFAEAYIESPELKSKYFELFS